MAGNYDKFTPVIQLDEITAAEEVALTELVALANSSSGQFIRKVGGSFVNETVLEVISLSDLSDAAISSAQTGDILMFNGSSWVNLRAGTSGQLLQAQGPGNALTWATAGGGTVTSVSVVTANGVSGSVATSTTTPVITITLGALTGVTSFNGLVVTADTGAITTGSWAGTEIGVTKGGTGLTSTTVSQILYSSATNTIAGLATANSAVLVTGATGIPSLLGTMTDGQLVIGSTGAIPVLGTITAGSNILVTNAAGAITISSTVSGGGANGRIYYPKDSTASDLTGYKVAATTPSSGAADDISISCVTQNAYVLGEEFATASGEPNTTSLPAGTAVRFLFANISGGTGQIKVDLFQYKTTGNVATTGAVTLTYVESGSATVADTITRADAGSFITDGFTAGCKITVAGTVSNNGTYTVQTVAAATLSLILSDDLVGEVVSSTITTKEKLLRTGSSSTFTNSTTQLIQFFYTDSSAHTLATDDRIIFKWWGRKTTAGGTPNILITTEGTTQASYIQTTLPVNLGLAQGTSLQLSGLTASEILGTDASKNLVSLAVATYPSLTELTYVKGVTSEIQTQIGTLLLKSGGTMTGNITLGEGADPATAGIVVDPSMSADERYSGVTIPATAGATIAFGDLCYLDVTATEWLLADASAATTSGSVILGICVDASADGAATSMLLVGTVRSAAFPASIALGAPVYVSETAGDITATQPVTADAVIRVLGWAVTVEPNTIYFNPSQDYITHV